MAVGWMDFQFGNFHFILHTAIYFEVWRMSGVIGGVGNEVGRLAGK